MYSFKIMFHVEHFSTLSIPSAVPTQTSSSTIDGSDLGLHLLRQALGSDQDVAPQQQLSDLVPIDLSHIKPQRDPAFRGNIRGEIKSAGLSLDQRLVVAGQYLAGNRDDTVSVMVIEEIGERLFADQEPRVRSTELARGLGQREPNLGQLREARIFIAFSR